MKGVLEWRGGLVDEAIKELLRLGDDDPLRAPPAGPQPLLLDPRPDLLSLDELTPEDFERLLLKVVEEVEGLREVHLYGVRGQRQHGLDGLGFDPAGRPVGFQAKRYRTFTARDLADAVDAYTSGEQPIRVVRLLIGVATEVQRTEILDELAAQRANHPELQIELYHRRRLSDLLRDRHGIVQRFFGDAAAERFCLLPKAEALSATGPPLDAVALADAVMRGPVEAAGMAEVLAHADWQRDNHPEEAADAYLRVEQELEKRRFGGHAFLVRQRRAAALRAAGRLDESAGLLGDSVWLYLDRGDVDDARIALHQLDKLVGPERPAARKPTGTSSPVSAQTQLLHQALEASVTLVQDPIDRMSSLGEVVDELLAARHPYAGRVAVLFAETALAAEQEDEITGRGPALRELSIRLAQGSEEDKLLSVRLRLCLTDIDGDWTELLDAARRRRLPNDQVALVLARHARSLAWLADPHGAEDDWRDAIDRGCLAGLYEDAANWLYAQRDLHIRYGPITEALEEPHHLAQALRAAGSSRQLIDQRRDPREIGLDRLLDNKLPDAADTLRRYLRISVVAGWWTAELDAHELLGDLFDRAGEPDLALHHLIRAGADKRAREVAKAAGERYIDVTEQLDRAAPWERAVAYQVIAEQGDLVPDEQAPSILDRALDEIDAVLAGRAQDPIHFGPGVYKSAHQTLAALAQRTSYAQARRILDHLEPLVPRGPDQHRRTDDEHINILVAVVIAHPALREAALEQLLGLLSGGDYLADRVLMRAQQLLQEHWATVLARLQHLAAGGCSPAARALGLLGCHDEKQRDRGRQALNRWTALREDQPGMTSFGTNAIQDSLLVGVLPAADRATFGARMLALAVDPDEPGWNRREFLDAATNIVSDLDPSQRPLIFEQAITIAQGNFPPSKADEDRQQTDHPLSRFRISLGGGDLRPIALQVAARVAITSPDARAVQAVALELLRQSDAAATHHVAVALSFLPKEWLTIDPRLLAAHPDKSLRMLAALRWAQEPTRDPTLGLSLARDPAPGVRRTLAKAISEQENRSAVEAVLETLRKDPRHSIRRTA
jgi:hypothetical protein